MFADLAKTGNPSLFFSLLDGKPINWLDVAWKAHQKKLDSTQ